MAIYEFQCQNCGKIEEVMQSYDIPAPLCCGRYMERKLSPVYWSFGWKLSDESFHVKYTPDKLVRNI